MERSSIQLEEENSMNTKFQNKKRKLAKPKLKKCQKMVNTRTHSWLNSFKVLKQKFGGKNSKK